MTGGVFPSTSRSIRHSSTKPSRSSPSSPSSTGGFTNRTAMVRLSAPISCCVRRLGSRWSSSGYTSRGMSWAGRSIRRSSSPRACFCWAQLVFGDCALRPRGPAANSGLCAIPRLLGFLDFGPAGALRGRDTGSALGTHAMFLLSRGGFRRALSCRRRGRRLPQHAAQFRHLRFNLLEMLLVTYQRRFQGGFVKTNGHIALIISCTDRNCVICFMTFRYHSARKSTVISYRKTTVLRNWDRSAPPGPVPRERGGRCTMGRTMRVTTRAWIIALALTAVAPGQRLALHYHEPDAHWQSQALPIGNGRLGAMIFGDARREHLQLNEISLWTGDEKDTGSYQNLADLHFDLAHGAEQSYQRRLDISSAVHTIQYRADGIDYAREYFASAPQQVLVFRFTADKPGAYQGTLKLNDAHTAVTLATGNLLTAAGQLANGLQYETAVQVVTSGGRVTASADGALDIENADALTILVAAGTNYVGDRARGWRGEGPHERIVGQLRAAAAMPFPALRAAHLADYQRLFRRVSLSLGAGAGDLPTDQRLLRYRDGAADGELEALFFQYGRYLLISSSRPGSLPANLQGLWNNSNDPPWRSDYHSNINIQMNYWLAEPTNLAECAIPFFDYVNSLRGVRAEATRQHYSNVRGWTVQTENNIFGAGSFKWNQI